LKEDHSREIERLRYLPNPYIAGRSLVFSRKPAERQLGIQKLREALNSLPYQQQNAIYYNLAIGYYREMQYTKALEAILPVLQDKPGSIEAVALKNLIEASIHRNHQKETQSEDTNGIRVAQNSNFRLTGTTVFLIVTGLIIAGLVFIRLR